MAYQALGLGTTANDGTGDSLRTGGDKVNDNFVEVYTKLGDGTTLTADTVTLLTASQTLTNKTLTSPTITGTGAIAGVFTGNVTGNCSGTSGSTTGNAATATALAAAVNIAGKSFDGSAAITIASTDLSDSATLVTAASTTTFTNKTLTSPIVGGDVTTASGNLSLDSATQIVEVKGDGSAVEGQIKLNCHANSHGQTIKPQPHSASVTNTMLLPAGASSTLVSLVSADTLTNKTLTSPTITGTGAIAGTFTGNIDGIVGGNTPAAVTGTAISGTSITVTGTAGTMKLNTMTTGQRNALTAAVGMIIYNSTTSKIEAYAGSAWVALH
jgi:hypothetical protein